MHIARENYIQALEDRMNNGLIKVVTGIRRGAGFCPVVRLAEITEFALAHALTLKMRYKETTC